ncbi:hypothetical protein TgHK011_002075 [Trichoderma gracile]|nr:hypothetical protein TgHK011_002075 [Trichoderma gracile]
MLADNRATSRKYSSGTPGSKILSSRSARSSRREKYDVLHGSIRSSAAGLSRLSATQPNQAAILRPAARQKQARSGIQGRRGGSSQQPAACEMPSCEITPAGKRCRRCKREMTESALEADHEPAEAPAKRVSKAICGSSGRRYPSGSGLLNAVDVRHDMRLASPSKSIHGCGTGARWSAHRPALASQDCKLRTRSLAVGSSSRRSLCVCSPAVSPSTVHPFTLLSSSAARKPEETREGVSSHKLSRTDRPRLETDPRWSLETWA